MEKTTGKAGDDSIRSIQLIHTNDFYVVYTNGVGGKNVWIQEKSRRWGKDRS